MPRVLRARPSSTVRSSQPGLHAQSPLPLFRQHNQRSSFLHAVLAALRLLLRQRRRRSQRIVVQKVKGDREVKVVRTRVRGRYPLDVITATLPGSKKDRYVLVTNVTHSIMEKAVRGGFSSRVYNVQDLRGWMEVKDHSVLSGTANTQQSFSYRDHEWGCYSRTIDAVDGNLIMDNSSFRCLFAS